MIKASRFSQDDEWGFNPEKINSIPVSESKSIETFLNFLNLKFLEAKIDWVRFPKFFVAGGAAREHVVLRERGHL